MGIEKDKQKILIGLKKAESLLKKDYLDGKWGRLLRRHHAAEFGSYRIASFGSQSGHERSPV